MRWIKTLPSIPIPFDETMLYKSISINEFYSKNKYNRSVSLFLTTWSRYPDIMKLALTTYNVCTT